MKIRVQRVQAGASKKGRKRFAGNAEMISKVLACADAAGDAQVKRERAEFRQETGLVGFEKRSAAQAKRERKRARALAERDGQ